MMQRALSYDPWVDFSGVDGAGEEEQRRPFLESRLMAIDGRLERSEGVQHLIVHRMENYGEMLEGLAMGSRDFK